jgi:hypothetical protein
MFTPVSSPPLSPILTPATALPLLFREMDEGPRNQWYDFPMSRASVSLRKVYLHFDTDSFSERSVFSDEFGDHVVRGQLQRPVSPGTTPVKSHSDLASTEVCRTTCGHTIRCNTGNVALFFQYLQQGHVQPFFAVKNNMLVATVVGPSPGDLIIAALN